MHFVKLSNIVKKYDKHLEVVHGINLEINEGEFMVLVGPSGCGKSTTLRMIAGLEDITEGTLEINNKVVNEVAPKDRNIAMVFQNYALYPHMTVYQNIAFGLKLAKLPKDEIDKRVREVATTLEIDHLLDRKPKNMSGGQRQRVALGRAIAKRASVYLFDEPLSNLDAKLRVSMRVRLSQLHAELKSKGLDHTMIYVTHDQVEAMTLGHRICVMEDGYIRQLDTPMNLYKYPANKFVAGFIGSPSMNFIEGVVKKEKDKYVIYIDDYKQRLTENKVHKLESYLDKKVIVGIRAEHISLKRGFADLGGLSNISVVEHMGNEDFIYFDFNGTPLVCRIPHGIELSPEVKDCYFSFASDEVHIFDIDTKENISLL